MLKSLRISRLTRLFRPKTPVFLPLSLSSLRILSSFSTQTGPVPPPNPDDSNQRPPQNPNPNSGNEFQVKLDTFLLESRKLELTPEEEALPRKTFVFFSSGQSALAKNNTSVTFDLGNLSESSLDHDIAFFMQAGDSTNKIYRVGMILDRSVNKSIKKELKKARKAAEEARANMKDAKPEDLQPKKSITTILKLREKVNRVKVAEIQINPDGILATCIPYKDLDSPTVDPSKPIIIDPTPTTTTLAEDSSKTPFPLHNELNRIYSLINIIKIYLGYDKISAFESTFLFMENREKMTGEKIDELLVRILGEIERIGRYLRDDFQLTSQVFIESRSLIIRTLFIRRKLEKIWESLEIVNRNFKMVDDNIKKLEMLNKAKMCLDLINYSADRRKDDAATNAGPSGQAPPWKKYMDKLNLIEDIPSREKIKKEIERFQQLERNSGEYHKISTYLDEVFSIPWNKFSDPYWNVKSTNSILEKNIYGLDKVKERILEMVAVNKLKRADKKAKGFVILLHGPPGTGKTSIAKNIATALRRTSRLISFSGVTDSYFIKGHRRTYVDSQPGVFIKEIIKAGVMNPVFILDEIDKLSQTRHGSDPYNALLEILNPEENANFVDHYLDIKVDFSNVIFILTANEIFHILEPLKNRLEIISIPGYIEEEKLSIAQNYILPQVLQESGVERDWVRFTDDSLVQIIKGWCYYENGVRELKRCIERIARKYVTEVMQKIPESPLEDSELLAEMKDELEKTASEPTVSQKSQPSITKEKPLAILSNTPKPSSEQAEAEIKPLDQKFEVKKENSQKVQIKHPRVSFGELASKLDFSSKSKDEVFEILRRFLGPPESDFQLEERTHKIFPPGILNILSVANHIGHVLKVECVYDKSKPDKKGEFTSSGNLKNVVQESIQIAKINAYRYLTKEQIEKAAEKNIHIHFMSGAQPKDGPSAGIAFCTAFLSLILEKPVPANWSMTGELSLKGDVSRIGGVHAKIIASKSLNIANIILPYANFEEVSDLPRQLLEGLNLFFVKEYKEVFDLIFEKNDSQIVRMCNGTLLGEEQARLERT